MDVLHAHCVLVWQQTPLDWAKQDGHDDLVEILEQVLWGRTPGHVISVLLRGALFH